VQIKCWELLVQSWTGFVDPVLYYRLHKKTGENVFKLISTFYVATYV